MPKRIYSFDDLINHIDSDLAWRRKELKVMRNLLPSTYSPKQTAILRSSVPLLYAHFEGFVKQCCEIYLKFVAGKHLKHCELKFQFIALSLFKKLGKLEANNLRNKTRSVEFLFEEYDRQSDISTKNIIQTKSNLSFKVFSEILFTINIEIDKFDKYKSLVNDLVDTRNYIAHGEHRVVDYKTYVNMYDEIEAVINHLKNEVENAAVMENYRLKGTEN